MSKVIKRAKSKAGGLIPELRFPEFVEDGEWELKILGDCLLKNPEYGINAPAAPYSDKLPTYLRITDISDDGTFITRDKVSVNRNVTEDNYLSEGDIVLARTGASVGKSYKYRKKDGKLVFAGFLIRVKPDTKKIDSELLFQFLYSEQYWKWVSFISARSGQPGINGTEYASMPINLPPTIPEQQKIASCLSSLDELIAAHNDKLQALKDHKKGLMQNLFPQEGEKVPKFRFPEFENDGEWVNNTLGEVATFSKGKGISKSDISENGSLPCIRYGELYTHYNETIRDIKSFTNLNSETLVLSEKNDVIIPSSGETHIDIATASCVMKEGVALGGDLNIIKTRINGVFLAYYLNNAKKKELAQIAQGISVVHLYANQLKTLVVYIPSFKEQQKIATCLSALDELITAQSEKVEHLQSHKKGLMQGLFPKIDN
ncbi:type I restriction enzyme S subunit [Marinilabilia salmonicolor]|jgi:type I restriction enzyme S subunit|uniref:restriction endonuclease subunit S n=1 Tax=Marinilabilia salmonicolor TaxID=989 RepID=UPI000D05FC9E|nr:restriction endonuclease subunit S [Marinilabilia salmonicolor]PRY91902.1 type I restriction enzyme S subunit [Marinilabilia salmonicolor]